MDENERKALQILVKTNDTLFLAKKSNQTRLNSFSEFTDKKYDRLKDISVRSLEKSLNIIYQEISQSLYNFEEYKNFLSNIDEINIFDCASLIVNIKNVNRFSNKKSFISYCGLAPVYRYDNRYYKPKKYDNKGTCVSNKKADSIDFNEELKDVLYRCTWKLVKENKEWNNLYNEYKIYYQSKNPKYSFKKLHLLSLKKTVIKFANYLFINFKKIQQKEDLK